jgi:hypothetical protein
MVEAGKYGESVFSELDKTEQCPAPKIPHKGPHFLTRRKRVVLEEGANMLTKLRLLSNAEPILSVYLNDEHLVQDRNIHLFVDRNENLWTIIFLINEVQTKRYDGATLEFVANSEEGVDKMIIDIEVNEKGEGELGLTNGEGPKFVETMPEKIELDSVKSVPNEVSFMITGTPPIQVQMKHNGVNCATDKVMIENLHKKNKNKCLSYYHL